MSNQKVGFGKILFHTLLTLVTGGLWLFVLGIWAVLKYVQR